MKAFTLVSFLLQTAIIVFGISIMLTVVLPAVEKVKVSSILNDALQQMRSIDFLVTQVASEAIGSQRVFDLRVTDGNYFINNRTGSLEFSLRTKNSPIPPGTTSKMGNILLSTSVAGARAYEDDVDADGEKELVLENEILKIGFEKYPKDYKIVGIGGEGYEFDSSGNSLDKGLVLYLPFEEGFGTITKDASGNENNGTLYNGPTWVDEKFGKALRFDGVDDFVSVPNSPSLTNFSSITVSIWIKPIMLSNYASIIDKLHWNGSFNVGWQILVYSDGRWEVNANNTWHYLWGSPPNLFNNNWYHLVMVYDDVNQVLKLYNNGVRTASKQGKIPLGPLNRALEIGRRSTGGLSYFNGIIDEVRIYNRALSDEEIKQLYEQTRLKFQNDFIQIKSTKTFLNITNSTNTLYSLFIPSIRLDGNPIYHYFSTNETKIYFFDWYSNSWKIWMQGVNNATHGSPDFSLPKFKQEFKLLYSFDSSKTDAKINLTFILTNHDPFLRTIIDVNSSKYHRLEIPIETQNQQKACLIADYSNGKLASWNQRNCAEKGNPYSSYSPVWNLKLPFNDTGLVGYWKFDEGSGTIAKDLSGYNNDGVLYSGSTVCSNPPTSGCPTWVDGKFGKALSFDGVDDYVRIPVSTGDSLDFAGKNKITVVAWVKALSSVTTNTDTFIGQDTSFFMRWRQGEGNNWGVGIYNGAWRELSVPGELNTWTHLALVYDGSILKLYKNGVLAASLTTYGNLVANVKEINIGRFPTLTYQKFNGIVDEVLIYNRALSEDEIKQLYEQQVIFYDSSYSNKGNEWNLSSQVNKTTDLLNATFYLDNDLFKTNTQQIELPLPDNSKAKVYYQSQDGSYRDVKELASIGQGLWSYEVSKDDSLVLWLSFDEGFGNIAHDFSDYGNDGVLVNGPTWVDGKYEKALQFNGVNNYVRVLNATGLPTSKGSISLWVRHFNTSRSENYVDIDDGAGGNRIVAWHDSSNIYLYISNTNVATKPISGLLINNEWQHLVFTWDTGNNDYRIYVNGLDTGATTVNPSSSPVGTKRITIGSMYLNNGYFFNGTIDEVRIYNKVLTPEEIKSHYLFGLPKHGIKNKLLLTSTLAGSDGFDYGIRDSYPGGSYWLDEKGNSLDSGLVGYWKFSEGSGTTTADSSGYGNTGTIYNGSVSCANPPTSGAGCPAWVDGKFGKALSFDGVDDYVDLGTRINQAFNEMTISVWVKHPPSGWQSIIERGIWDYDDGFGLFMYNDGQRVAWGHHPDFVLSNKIVQDNQWHHIVAVMRSNKTYELYIDGLFDNSRKTTRLISASTQPTRIGADGRTPINHFFNGTIDEVRIYNRALSEEEIKALYQAGRIKISNDFLTVQSHPTIQTNLTNSTNSNLFNLIAEEIKVDNQPITNIYPANPINNSINVYFFDWKDNTWKIWMKGANNLTHGMPDWLDPRFKQEFKWRYEFKRANYPSINITYLITAHDPFVRVFVDVVNSSSSNKIDIPITLGQSKNLLDDSLVLYLPFEEGFGNYTYDYSNFKNTGTIYNGSVSCANPPTSGAGCPTWVDGKFGKALSFDGVNDYVNVGNSPSLNPQGPFTISFWIKSNVNFTGQDGPVIIDKRGGASSGYAVYNWRSGFTISVFLSGTTYYNEYPIDWDVTKWHHYIAMWNGTHTLLYVDSIFKGSKPATGTMGTNTLPLYIGIYQGSSYPFNGIIDEVRIYNRALSEEEIWQLYQLGQTRIKTGNYYYRNSTNENILFTTQNFRTSYRGSFANPTESLFNLTENTTTKTIIYSYVFNSTLNQNFMFTLGNTGYQDTSINTTSFTINRTLGFSNETLESVANSTLTYYDLKDDSLVGYWDFDEGSGTIAGDRSGNGNTGTLYNGTVICSGGNCPNWVDGKFGKALSFDGVDDYVGVTINVPEYNFTIGMWIKTTCSNCGVFEVDCNDRGACGHDRHFYISNGYACHRVWQGSGWCANKIVNDGNWHHWVLVVQNGVGQKAYIDGQLVGTFAYDHSDFNWQTGLTIGFSNDAVNKYFNGIIDEVRIYNRALSEEEIKAHYYSGLKTHQYGKFENPDKNVTHTFSYSFKYNSTYVDDFNVGIKRYVGVEDSLTNLQPITPKDTVLHLRFNEGSGNITKDISGFGNDGTIYGQTNSNTTVLQLTGSSPISLDHYIPGYKPEKPATLVVYYINNTADLSYNTVTVKVNGYSVGSFNDTGETSVQTINFTINPAYLLDGNNKITYTGNVTNITRSDLILDPWVSRSNFGKALKFDGWNDYVGINIPVTPNPIVSNKVTISMWVNFWNTSGEQSLVEIVDNNGQGYYLNIGGWGNNSFQFAIVGFDVAFSGVVPQSGRWYHVVGTYDGTTIRIYVDGEYKASRAATYSQTNTSYLNIGHSVAWGGRYVKGIIDEVLIINRSLSEDEIKQLYLGGYFRRIGNNTHRVASYDNLNYISFNLTDKDDSSQTDYDQRKLRIEVDYSRNPEGLASFVFSNSTNNLHGLQSMNLPYIALINSNSQDKAQFITTSHKTQSFEPLRISSNENGIIRKVSFDYDFNGSKRFSFSLGYSGLVDTAIDNDNNKIPDYLEDKTKGIEWSNESISSIASSTLTYYDIKDNPYKMVPEWKGIEGDFGGDFKIGIQDVKIGNVWYHPLGVEGAINYATRTINSTLAYKMFYPLWPHGWTYKKPILINNTLNSNNLTDYQVLVTLDTQSLISQGKMRSDCGDIRFIDSDGTTLLNYWIESGCNTTNTKIWVKVPSIPASSTKTIYVYYGNPNAKSLSNGDAVFDFFDDFLGTSLDTNKWTTGGYGGWGGIYYSVSNSILTEWSDNNWRILRMNKNFAPSDTIAIEVKFLKTADSSWHTNYLVQYNNVNNNRLGLADWVYTGANMGIQLIVNSGTSYPKDFGPFSSNVWYISRIIKKNSTTLYLDALTSDRSFINSYETTQSVWSSITWTWVNWQYENIQVKYDWIFTRKYTSPEPTTSVGNEEVRLSSPELRFSLNGSVVSTNDLIKSIKYKGQTEILPVDSSVRINENESSTYGFGRTYLVTQGEGLDQAQLIAEVNSLNGSYKLTYSLPSMADYLIISTDYPYKIENSYGFKIGNSVTNDNIQISGSTLPPACYNASQITNYYACSYDSTEGVSSGLIYKGLKTNFEKLCYSNYTHWDNTQNYKLSVESENKEELILPLIKGSCDKISSKYYLIQADKLPKNFGDLSFPIREALLQLSLSYKNIKIVGSDVYPRGTYTLCIRKEAEDLVNRITYVRIGSC